MMSPVALLLAYGLLAQAPTASAPSGSAELVTAAQVRRLVAELDGDTQAERDAAEKKLLELGPAVLPFLPPLTAKTAPEIRDRVPRIQRALQTRLAERSTQATRVNLEADDQPALEVLGKLAAATGNPLHDHRAAFGQQPKNPRLNVKFAATPYWQALDETLDQAGLTLYPFTGEKGLGIVNREEGQRPRVGRAAYAGPFRIEAAQIVASRDPRQEAGHTLTVQLEVAWEPRLRPISLRQRAEDLRGQDDAGGALRFEGGTSVIEADIEPGATATRLPVRLVPPPRSVAALASVRGKLTAIVPTQVEKFAFDQLADAKNVEQRKADSRVTLERVRKQDELYEMTVVVRYDRPGEALESHRGWMLDNPAYLIRDQGQRLEPAAIETARRSDDEVALTYVFAPPQGLAGWSLVYETPTLIMDLAVEYELKGILLP